MEVSKRITEIVDLIENSTLVDIGTDHGYIPILAIKEGKVKYAIASDVNIGPLNRARENINIKGYENLIDLRLGNGLEKINKNDGETLVIAGMGGLLIKSILAGKRDILSSFSQVILQPQSDIDIVRKYVHKLGFYIRDEKVIFDMDKYYFILNCRLGKEENYSDKEYIFGRKNIERLDKVFISYIKFMMDKTKKIVENINKNSKDIDLDYLYKLNSYITISKELLDTNGD